MYHLLAHAFHFAAEAHKDQRRKYTDEPYINHCARVAHTVSQVTGNEHAIAAALLHDTLEDTDVDYLDLVDDFGSAVADFVVEVTDVSKHEDGNRAVRKELDRQHIAKASYFGKTIKLADLIDNTSTIVQYDPKFSEVYMKEKEALLKVLYDGNQDLYIRACDIVEAYKHKVG